MKKKFDAVKMVRDIRDNMHEETKKMSTKQEMEYYGSALKWFHVKSRTMKVVS